MDDLLELMLESNLLVLISLTINVVYSGIIFYLAIIRTKRELANIVQKLPFLIRKEMRPSNCLYSLGYLHNHPRDKTIPEECWGCPQLLECIEHKPSDQAEENGKTGKKSTSSAKAKTKPKRTTRKKKG